MFRLYHRYAINLQERAYGDRADIRILKNLRSSLETLRARPEFIEGTDGAIVKSLVVFRPTELAEV